MTMLFKSFALAFTLIPTIMQMPRWGYYDAGQLNAGSTLMCNDARRAQRHRPAAYRGPAYSQSNVASLVVKERYVTVAAANNLEIASVAATGDGVMGAAVPGVSFPEGLIQYTVRVTPQQTQLRIVQQAGMTTITHIFPEGTKISTYWIYGPTRDNPKDHWYAFMYDGTTGAEIQDNKLILHFVDGLRGDSDLTENGKIVLSPGGPVNVENGAMDLANAILILQIMTRMDMPAYPSFPISDINRDGKIGLAEALNILQSVAGMRD